MEKNNVRVISSRVISAEEDRLQRVRVLLQQTGGDPSAILELLSTIVKNKDWRHIPDERSGNQTFLGYFHELGWSKDDLLNFINHMHHKYEKLRPEIKTEMEELRSQVRDLTNSPLQRIGAPIGSRNAAKSTEWGSGSDKPTGIGIKVDNINFNSKAKGGTSASYAIQRLKRDAPELAEKVIRGEMTPRAAAIQAGIRTAEFNIPIEPHAAARRILNRFQGEPLLELARVLANHAGYELRKRE